MFAERLGQFFILLVDHDQRAARNAGFRKNLLRLLSSSASSSVIDLEDRRVGGPGLFRQRRLQRQKTPRLIQIDPVGARERPKNDAAFAP